MWTIMTKWIDDKPSDNDFLDNVKMILMKFKNNDDHSDDDENANKCDGKTVMILVTMTPMIMIIKRIA